MKMKWQKLKWKCIYNVKHKNIKKLPKTKKKNIMIIKTNKKLKRQQDVHVKNIDRICLIFDADFLMPLQYVLQVILHCIIYTQILYKNRP